MCNGSINWNLLNPMVYYLVINFLVEINNVVTMFLK
jgi:hypothetical protein